jgi:hypothetical protein
MLCVCIHRPDIHCPGTHNPRIHCPRVQYTKKNSPPQTSTHTHSESESKDSSASSGCEAVIIYRGPPVKRSRDPFGLLSTKHSQLLVNTLLISRRESNPEFLWRRQSNCAWWWWWWWSCLTFGCLSVGHESTHSLSPQRRPRADTASVCVRGPPKRKSVSSDSLQASYSLSQGFSSHSSTLHESIMQHLSSCACMVGPTCPPGQRLVQSQRARLHAP